MRRYKLYGNMLLAAFLTLNMLSGQAEASEVSQAQVQAEVKAESENQPLVQQKTTGIVILGSECYLQPAYLDIMNRYFVRCYSQYRYPTEYGEIMQDKCREAMTKEKLSSLHNVTEKQLAELVNDMDKEQILFIRISDVVRQARRRIDRWLGSEDVWEANVTLEALLVDKNGIVRREKFYDYEDEQYSPDRALGQAYTNCIRKLQKKNIFQQ